MRHRQHRSRRRGDRRRNRHLVRSLGRRCHTGEWPRSRFRIDHGPAPPREKQSSGVTRVSGGWGGKVPANGKQADIRASGDSRITLGPKHIGLQENRIGGSPAYRSGSATPSIEDHLGSLALRPNAVGTIQSIDSTEIRPPRPHSRLALHAGRGEIKLNYSAYKYIYCALSRTSRYERGCTGYRSVESTHERV